MANKTRCVCQIEWAEFVHAQCSISEGLLLGNFWGSVHTDREHPVEMVKSIPVSETNRKLRQGLSRTWVRLRSSAGSQLGPESKR